MAWASLIDRLSPNITAPRHALDASSLWTASGTETAPHEIANCCRYACRDRHQPLVDGVIVRA